MLTSTLARTTVLALVLGLASSCAAPINPRPAQAGDWHIEGDSSALYSQTQGGDHGDTDNLAARFTGGRFVNDQILVEGIVGVSASKFTEDGTNNELKTTTMDLGVGGRYYTNTEGSTRPYIAVNTGFNFVDIHDDFTGNDDSDNSPFVGASLGFEAFVGSNVAVDMGFSWQEIFSRDLGSTSDNLNTYGVFVGFSLWL